MDHPIHNMLKISMENIKEMIDVNTIIGEPIILQEKLIVPVSKVKFGFASGGTEQKISNDVEEMKVPFGGGTGGSVSIAPIAFLVIDDNDVKVLHLDNDTHIYEKIIDKIPTVLNSLKDNVYESEQFVEAFKR